MKQTQSMSVRDVARTLGVSIKFVYDLIWAGTLQAEKVGKTWRVPATAVDARIKLREQRHA